MTNAVPPGFALDPSTVFTDVTLLPVGQCLAGYTGAFVAEASSVACYCSAAVPAGRTTWGMLKLFYR